MNIYVVGGAKGIPPLIYIYLESMESSYANIENGGMFEDNYIPNLTKLAYDNIHFSETDLLGGARQITGTGWTIASLFAQTSGLHFNIPIYGNNMDKHAFFFPGVKSLGDILAEQGYTNIFLIGSDAQFGGRELYFSSHGNYEIYDYPWAIEAGYIPSDYYVWWGYEDAKLYEYAKIQLIDLAAKDEPFNFTMLTADTHHQDGYVSEGDYQEIFPDQYANVIATSDRQLAKFIQWVQEQDFYDDTTIVITGDHYTMDSDFFDEFDSTSDRRIYNAFINVPGQENRHITGREFSLIDMYPTTLSALGVTIPGNRLGLGVNLFSSEKTILEKYGQETADKELRKKSNFYNKLLFTSYTEI